MRAVRLAALALACALLGTPAGAAIAAEDPGSIGVRLLEAPVSRKGDPRARQYVIDHVQPGDEFSRKIGVSNTTGSPVRLKLYVGPASIKDGQWSVATAGSTSEVTEWITLSRRQVVVPPGSEATVEATVAVPADAGGGERYGVIWASAASTGSGNVQMVNRVGIRVYLSVGGPAEPKSDFEISALTPSRTKDGSPVVQAEVTNTGGRALDMRGELQLTDGPGGLKAGPFPAETGTTLGIDQTAPVTVVLDKALPNGPWTATLTLTSGTLERTVKGELTFPEPGQTGDSITPDVVGSGLGAAGWTLIVLGIAVALLLAGWWLLTWRRRPKHRPQSPEDVEAANRAWLASLDEPGGSG